ncbi:MAG: hypothetical protein JSV52_06195 [Candidatus Zixiibacteriota bacterium]|nr:MAG: hypothetical protein JSV52_06195 [candidate division Zixibacteria bacterium]
MNYEIKSIPIWPLTRLAFFVNLIVGFIGGIFLAVFMVPLLAFVNAMAAYDTGYIDIDAGPTGAAAMMLPFLSALWCACFGTLFVIILGLVYNLTAKIIGGVECHLEPTVESAQLPDPTRLAPSKPESVIDRPLPPPPVTTEPPPSPPEGETKSPGPEPGVDESQEGQPNS